MLENNIKIQKYKKPSFLSKVKFSSPKITCKQCFLQILNEKNIIQTIIRKFGENHDNLNSNCIKCIEIEIDESVGKSSNINCEKNDSNRLKLRTNNNGINNNYKFKLTDNINSSDYTHNLERNIISSYINNYYFINNNISNINKKENEFIINNIISNNLSNFKNFNKFNIVINDIFCKNNIIINSDEKEKLNEIEISAKINDEKNNFFNIFNDYNYICNKEKFYQDSENIKNSNGNRNYFNSNLEDNIKSNLINNQINKLNELKNKDINPITNNIKDKKNEIGKNIIKYLFSNNFLELILCLNELKEKILNISRISQQLKYQYNFLINYYPNLFDIILSYKNSFFLLNFIASSEILNILVLSHNYISQRINILLEIVNYLENNQNLNSDGINELQKLKANIQKILLQSEKNNKNFRESMDNFLAFLKGFTN